MEDRSKAAEGIESTGNVVEALAKMVLDLCPTGSATAPDSKVQAFYLRMGELRELKALANEILSDA